MTTITQSMIETTTTVRLKVASSTQKTLELTTTSSPSSSCTNDFSPETKADLGGWSFLQALSNVSSNLNEKMDKENVYVPPLSRNYSSSRLSEKSLELCTENLGCETGSDIMDCCNMLSLSMSPSNSSPKEEGEEKLSEKKQGKLEYSSSSSFPPTPKTNYTCSKVTAANTCRKFPPPLTTMSNGTGSLQFRPHREDGRLVITAVEAPLKQAYFKAERSQGRLRLTFLEEHAPKFDSRVSDVVVDEEENEAQEEDDESDEEYEESAELDNDFSDEDYHHHHHRSDEDDDDHHEETGAHMSKNMKGNIFDIEIDVGMEKFQRLINSRCNEGANGTKGLCNWEPLWVATS